MNHPHHVWGVVFALLWTFLFAVVFGPNIADLAVGVCGYLVGSSAN